jgi:acyl-CoA synthetase (NDP forming)
LGRLGIVTQSGAVGSYCYALAVDRGLGLSTFVATGNEADIDVADCIAWMAEDDQTSVILGYLEGCRDGWRLRQALTAARQAGKPVILMKGGSSDAGAQAGASHTGSLAGADRVFDAAFRETGAYRANSIEEMIDVASGCIGLEGNFPTGRNLGIFTVSGGVGILMADAATEFNLSLPILSDAAEAKIKSLVPFATSRNPVDATAQILNDFTIMTSILRTMVEDRNFNIITLFLQDLGRLDQYVDRFREEIFAMKAERPSTTFLICGGFLPRVAREFRAHGFLIFEDPRRTVHMAAALATIGAGLKAADGSCLGYKLRSTARSADAAVDGTLDELQSRALLHQADIPFVPAEFAGSRGAAVAAAEAIGFPVVLKVVSKDVAHKSDVGGVAVFLADANAVEMAWDRVMKSVAKAVPDAVIDGALICAMVTEGTEVVMGVHRDPAFGPVAMFGLGGVFVEIFNDVSFGLTPLSKDSALSMIRNIKGFPLLQGARGKPGADIEQLADILCRLAAFAETNQDTISSVELNPILAGPRGAVAVDALVIRERNDARIR